MESDLSVEGMSVLGRGVALSKEDEEYGPWSVIWAFSCRRRKEDKDIPYDAMRNHENC